MYRSLARLSLTAGLVAALAGCAGAQHRNDPLEPMNRAVFKFNDAVDDAVLKPLATGYRKAVPSPVRTGVRNFFSNIGDLFVAANNLLQGKVGDAASDVTRFAFNSTFGFFGVLDWATELGLEKHDEDFGQTLGRWGLGSGPYLVLPILGPSSLRDATGTAVQVTVDPVANYDDVSVRNSMLGIRLIDTRAGLLDATSLLEEAALDRYTFTRDAYLQRRRSLVYDGNPPREDLEELEEEEAPKGAAPAAGALLERQYGGEAEASEPVAQTGADGGISSGPVAEAPTLETQETNQR